MSCSCDCTSVSSCPSACTTYTPCVGSPSSCNQCLRSTEPQQLGWVPKDVGGMFVAASNAVSAPTLKKTDKIQLLPGDMYRSCPEACAFLVSNDYPEEGSQVAQFSCIPLQVHLFVLGPLVCDKQLMAVLLVIQQITASGQKCTSLFGLYSPCSGTVRLRNNTAFVLDGTNTRFGFRANLPLAGMTGCQALSSVRAELSLKSACDAAMQALFDKALNGYMAPSNGFAHVVDWTCLVRLKLLAASGSGGLLPQSSTSYQGRGAGDSYLTCPACSSDSSGSCDCCTPGTAWTTCDTVTDCVDS